MVENPELQSATTDPLLCGLRLSHQARLFPLGFPVDIETNSSAVLDAAQTSWARFSQEFDEAPIRLSIGIAAPSGEGPPSIPIYRAREHLLSIVSDASNFLMCDCAGGFAFGWLTSDAVTDAAFFRYYFLEAAALTLLNQAYLAAVHGALVALNGRGILLCGESCAGKSTLAYASARDGFTFISDDGIFLPRNRTDRFGLGNPHTVRLREDAPLLFPELVRWPPSIRANGKFCIEVPVSELDGVRIASGCNIDHVVFLDRDGIGPASLRPRRAEDALRWFQSYACHGSESTRDAQHNTYRRLLSSQMWDLRYRDLDHAVVTLGSLVRGGF